MKYLLAVTVLFVLTGCANYWHNVEYHTGSKRYVGSSSTYHGGGHVTRTSHHVNVPPREYAFQCTHPGFNGNPTPPPAPPRDPELDLVDAHNSAALRGWDRRRAKEAEANKRGQ